MDVENLIKMYSELLQRVILVAEGVAQASNCDSVALLLDHPRLHVHHHILKSSLPLLHNMELQGVDGKLILPSHLLQNSRHCHKRSH